jgi:hypothetical protein
MVGMRLSALRLSSLRMIWSEDRTPRFWIMRVPEANLFCVVVVGKARARNVSRERFCLRVVVRVPDAVQRDSGAPQIRDRRRLGVRNDPGSAAHHFVVHCARETLHVSKE